MEDIKVDENGDLRCSNCGGKNFTQKRTRKAKVIGVTAGIATVGVAGAAVPLIAKQKLYCQACGTYNRMGSAKPYSPKAKQDAKSASVQRASVPARKPSSSSRKSSREEDILFSIFLTIVTTALFIWAIVAGSIFWSILTGLLVAGCGFMVYVSFTMKRPNQPSRNRK